jgi:hypothetical protein
LSQNALDHDSMLGENARLRAENDKMRRALQGILTDIDRKEPLLPEQRLLRARVRAIEALGPASAPAPEGLTPAGQTRCEEGEHGTPERARLRPRERRLE